MKVFEITVDNVDKYIDYYGLDIVEEMDRVYYRGIGAVDDDENMTGAMIYELINMDSDNDTRSAVRYIKYDNEDVFNAMIQDYLDKEVELNHIKSTYYETTDERLAKLFEMNDFSVSKKESNTIDISLEEISKNKLLKSRQIPNSFNSIASIPVLKFRDTISKFVMNGQRGSIEDLPFLPMNWYDQDVSICYRTGDDITGLFLVRYSPSGILMPVFLYVYGKNYANDIIMMFILALSNANKKYPPDVTVRFNIKRKEMKEILKKLFPKSKGKEVFCGMKEEAVYSATTDDED